MNLLICSAGRRVKLVEYFKEELNKMNGKVIAVDCDPTAPALYAADFYQIVARIDDDNYMKQIKSICRKYKVKGILSLIDPELTILSERKEEFEQEGIKVIISNEETIDICFDKFKTYQYLKNAGIPTIPTYIDIDEVLKEVNRGELQFPLMAKPRKGSASIGNGVIHNREELEILKDTHHDMVFQPFIMGEEYGIDCYIDLLSKETIDIFIKKKVKMRAGETDKSISVNDVELKNLIKAVSHVLELVGPVDIDCFGTNSSFVVSEINPRFGGGYPHAHEMGRNFVRFLINNMLGESNCIVNEEYEEGVTMVKFDRVMLLPMQESKKIERAKVEFT